MATDLQLLKELIETKIDGLFLKEVQYQELREKIRNLLNSKINDDEAIEIFLLSMDCFPLFAELLSQDLQKIPPILRFSLLSKLLYSEGSVLVSDSIQTEVEDMIESSDRDWYLEEDIGYKIYNLRDRVLQNATIDAQILEDEFENAGDIDNLMAILRNPICPREVFAKVIKKEHFVFTENTYSEETLEALVQTAQQSLNK